MASKNYFCNEFFCNNFGRAGRKGLTIASKRVRKFPLSQTLFQHNDWEVLNEDFSSFFVFFFLRFLFLRLSGVLLEDKGNDCNLLQNGECHSAPNCTDPVRNFPKWTVMRWLARSQTASDLWFPIQITNCNRNQSPDSGALSWWCVMLWGYVLKKLLEDYPSKWA